MFRQPPRQRSWFSLLLIVSLFSSSTLLPFTASAKDRKPVVVSFGQPNIWSLEQAHYLLARMHMLNLDLQAKTLTADDLNPNIAQGTRIQILKQLLQISAQFDQGAGFQNQRLVENARFNDARRRELITHRSGLRDRSLVLTGEISDLEVDRARMDTDKDATAEQKALKDQEIKSKKNELAQVKELISQDTDELGTAPQAASTPVDPNALPSPTQLPSSVLDALVKDNAAKLLDAAKDPKLNATTMLDNTIQLQYEIVSKQLTLLRDEVGPGERLVFLELPQSIYTTPGDGDEKMAQSWWHVNGYTRTDPLLRLLLELLEIEVRWKKIKDVQAYKDLKELVETNGCNPKPDKADDSKSDETKKKAQSADKQKESQPDQTQEAKRNNPLCSLFVGLKREHEAARKIALENIFREANNLFARVEQNGARDTSEQIDLIRRMITLSKPKVNDPDDSKKKDPGQKKKDITIKELPHIDARRADDEKLIESTSSTIEEGRRNKINILKNMLLMVLSREDPLSDPDPKMLDDERFNEFKRAWEMFKPQRDNLLKTNKSIEFEKAMEFVRLDDKPGTNREGEFDVSSLPRKTVRTVDIIPRQSSLNVNDIQETVKQTGILAGFKFLFGFAGSLNFQRQREQFEQFLHQELYASGFGKGSRDFGWTFGAVPGTKRVAPGVRTTYAALVVPDDAESVVLSARGCYFPSKNFQPLDYQDTADSDWDQPQRYRRSNCGGEENYVLTIPGGGDVSNFWVTNIDYDDGRKSGDFITVSVRGNNFSSQMGVLVDGVPLFPTIGLAQQFLMPRKPGANGADPPPLASDCVGAAGICGRYERVDAQQIVFSFKMPAAYTGTPTITLIGPGKSIDLNGLTNVRINRQPVTLRDEAGVMFGTTGIVLNTLEVRPQASSMWDGYLSGSGFVDKKDKIYVNGVEVQSLKFRSANLYDITFKVPPDENLNVMVVRDKQVVSKSFPNPAVVKITGTTVVNYTPAVTKGKQKRPSVLLLKLNGVGFTEDLQLYNSAPGTIVSTSPTEMIVELKGAELPAVVTVRDKNTGVMASGVAPKEEPKEPKEKETKPPDKPKEPETKPKGEAEQKPPKPKKE